MIKLSAFSDEAAADLEGQIAALKRNDVAYTELRSVNGKNVKDFTLKEAREISAALKDNGIAVWSLGSPLGKEDIGLNFAEYLDTVKHVCELANVFGTDKIRIFSFYNAYGERNKVFDYLGRMAETAKAFHAELFHENEKEIYGDTADRVLEIMQNVKGLKYVYDPANYIQTGEAAERTISLLHAKTDYFHIKDVIAETGEIVPAGCGDGKIEKLIELIDSDKVMTLEPHLAIFDGYAAIDGTQMKHKYRFRNSGEAFDTAVASLKSLLEKAGYRKAGEGYVK